jgi:hypothetical protein
MAPERRKALLVFPAIGDELTRRIESRRRRELEGEAAHWARPSSA